MTTLPERILSGEVEAPDLFCGGTPCQAFSVAGLRNSLDDARGNLSLTFCEIANAIDHVRSVRSDSPGIIFWENVPGVLSTKDNAFGCFLGALAGEVEALEPPGGKWTNAGCVSGPTRTVAWRVLDAQYFGVAQRRRRVFVVASARDNFDPAAVLFEFDGVRRDIAPSREAGQKVANALTDRADRGGTNSEGQRLIAQPYAVCPTLRAGGNSTGGDRPPGTDVDTADSLQVVQPYSVANCLTARMHKGINTTLDEGQTPVVTHSLRGEGFDASEDGTGRGTPLVAVRPDVTPKWQNDLAFTLTTPSPSGQVRRLTPVECERLQGFPDGYTAFLGAARQPISAQTARGTRRSAIAGRCRLCGGSEQGSMPIFRSKKLLEAVRQCPCAHCGAQDGTVVAAHRNEGKGMGIKVSDALVAALCFRCHAELDQGATLSRDERRNRWNQAYIKTMQHMIEAKLLEVK
jgi:DNA (cytosine-5)-methyltransferase 1